LKRKWIIITITLTFLIGGLKASPVFASNGDLSQSLLQKFSLFRTNEHFAFTRIVNSILSFTDVSEYILPSKLVQSHHPEIQELATELTMGLKTNEDKSKAIFKWVASNISYDAESYFRDPSNPRYYSSLETLRDKQALCSGYANLNAALHRSIGIEARVVYGEGHAWNEVKISNSWIEQDPTYASGGLDMNNKSFIPQFNEQYFSSVDLRREGIFPW
jgi:transglutaminase-like putative cysteine protease